MAGKFSIEAVFKAIDKFSAPVGRMQTKLDKFGRNASLRMGRLNKTLDGVNGKLKTAAMASTAAAVATGAALGKIVSVGAEFEQSLVNASVKFGEGFTKGTAGYAALKASALAVGEATEFTASQAAQGLNILGGAGFTAAQAMGALPKIIDLATVSEQDFATAADWATKSLGALGKQTKDPIQLTKNFGSVVDFMAKTSDGAQLSLGNLFETISEGASPAIQAGLKMEQVGAIASVLSQNALVGSKAGTALKNVVLGLSAPSSVGAKALKKLNMQVSDFTKTNIGDVFATLEQELSRFDKPTQTRMLVDMFGREGLVGIQAILSSGSKEFKKFEASIAAAEGTAGKNAALQRATTLKNLAGTMSALEGVGLRAFDVIQPHLDKIITSTTEWLRLNKDAIGESFKTGVKFLSDNLPTIATWSKRIVIGFAAWGGITLAIKATTTAVTVFNATLAVSKGIVAGAKLAATGYSAAMVMLKGANLGAAASFAAVNMSLGAIAATAGLAAVAIGSVYAAWKLNDNLKSKTEGLGMGGIVSEMWKQGTWDPAKAVDEYQNKLARDRASHRNASDAIAADALSKYTVAPIDIPGERIAEQIRISPVHVPVPQVVSPAQQSAAANHSLNESRSVERNELLIRDQTGKATFTKPPGKRSPIKLQPSGAL